MDKDTMDTGDLSVEAYKAIMIEADMFNHDLTLQFGLLSEECKDEDDFIEKSIQLINEMNQYDLNDLDDMFFGDPPDQYLFRQALKKIHNNIIELIKIPTDKRTYD